jgi:hypothetical protein
MKSAYEKSLDYTNGCPYRLLKDSIEINPDWIYYLQRNVRMLRDFCYWNLAMYLQSKNPCVPDIPNKLIKSPARKNLTEHRKLFWMWLSMNWVARIVFIPTKD